MAYKLYTEASDSLLLLDGTTVEKSENCTLSFKTALKDPSSPVITGTEPWEGGGPYIFSGNILSVEEGLRLYYVAWENTTNLYRIGIAESADGLCWHKPKTFERKLGDRTVFTSVDVENSPHIGWPSMNVVRDPRPETPEERRYCGMGFTYQGTKVYFSSDGRSWKPYANNPVWHGSSDIIHCIWDERLGKFLCYYKLWRLQGISADDGCPVDLLFTTFNEKTLPDGTSEITGPAVTQVPSGEDIITHVKLRLVSGGLSSDDGGGGHLLGAWNTRRVVCRAESEDFITWKNGAVVLDTDSSDRPGANIQIAHVFYAGGYYLAFLAVHDQRGFFDQQFAFSADGVNWNRPWRGNIVSRGAPGEFDCGMITEIPQPIVSGSKMLLYYGASGGDHTDNYAAFSVGRAILRRDGFAARVAGDTAATLRTRPIRIKKKQVLLNANAEGGWVTGALFTPDGAAIPGFGHGDCTPFDGDSASFENCFGRLTWRSGDFPTDYAGEDIVLELKFARAEVYSVSL